MGNSANKEAFEKNSKELAKATAEIQAASSFDKVEAAKLYQAFNSCAILGKVNKEQFRRALKHLDGFGLKDDVPFMDRLFDVFDVNNDGKVDLKEFAGGLSLLCKGNVDEKVELTFKAYDLDGSGFITRDEMVEMFVSTYSSALSALKATSKSAKKSYNAEFLDEFVGKFREMIDAWIASMWDTWDKNKDGKLSLEEFKHYVSSEPYVAATLNGLRAEVSMHFK